MALYELPKKDEQLTEEDVRAIVVGMQQTQTTRNVLAQGLMQSSNFVDLVSGWQLSPTTVKFFGGMFNIGGTVITINNTQDIQTNLNTISTAGGGTLYLQPGTYTLTADISIPGGVTLEGVVRDSTIINCNSSYKVQMVGSNAYTTGTLSITKGATAITGSGTVWISGMIGRHILLEGLWYKITAVGSNTSMTIGSPLTGDTLSGATYTLATINVDAKLKRLTVQNATGSGIKGQYTMETIVDDVYVFSCGIGIDFDQSVFPIIRVGAVGNGVNLDFNEVWGFTIDWSLFDDSTTGAGVVMLNSGDATFFNTGLTGNIGNGISLTGCRNIAFLSVGAYSNTGNGIELISGNKNLQFVTVGAIGNTLDGYKFTANSDTIMILSAPITNNGGFGINIANANCDNNVISSNVFTNNTAGNVQNLGTGTIITGNSPSSVNQGGTTYKNGIASKTLNDADTTQNIAHGLGIVPKKVKISGVVAVSAVTSFSIGTYNGTTNSAVFIDGVNGVAGDNTTNGIHLQRGGVSAKNVAVITVDATNIMLAWVKSGTPGGVASLLWEVEG